MGLCFACCVALPGCSSNLGTAIPALRFGKHSGSLRMGSKRYLRVLRRRLPANGHSRVDGIRLPDGHRDAYGLLLWSTDDPVPDAVALAAKLARVFPQTGLWPLLWPSWDRPASYMDGARGLGGITSGDVSRYLTARWVGLSRANPFLGGFPGLAAGSSQASTTNPFAILQSNIATVTAAAPGPYDVLLVPCDRPADAITVVGYEITGPTNGIYASILRSWEDRFGAHLVMLTPDGREMFAVQSPPQNVHDARRLGTELLAATAPQTNPSQVLGPLTEAVLTSAADAANVSDPTITATRNIWAIALGDS